ncbi:MAG: hypothetical protein U0350_50310 [Caldilineaceae bacterium]
MVAQFQGRAYKALRPASAEEAFTTVAQLAPLGPNAGPSVMIDAYDPHLYGGTANRGLARSGGTSATAPGSALGRQLDAGEWPRRSSLHARGGWM